MKPLFTNGIIILCLFDFGQIQSQPITLTFSGIKDGQPVMLNSIVIQNLDKACDTTLYYPVTSLTLQLLGIGNHPINPAGFTVFQNVPNPAGAHTTISVYQPTTGEVSVKVTELTGRQVASFTGELNRGYHVFDFIPGSADVYLFSAGCSGLTRSIMIVSATSGGNGLCMLKYAGNMPGEEPLKSAIPVGGFTFALGDHLRFTGHHDSYTAVIEDAPQGSMDYTFDFSSGGAPCPGIPTVTFSGQTYHTVLIGNQCWLKENLNIGTRINGSQDQTNNGVMEKYCYGDNEANCNTYGGLYQWDELMQYVITEGAKGICPDGWHIPTDAEWTTLINYLGGVFVAGGKMKETGTTHWFPPNTGATNSSGFTALPGGYRLNYGNFGNLTSDAYFWSSTVGASTTAWLRDLSFNDEYVDRDSVSKTNGISCRCLKDQ